MFTKTATQGDINEKFHRGIDNQGQLGQHEHEVGNVVIHNVAKTVGKRQNVGGIKESNNAQNYPCIADFFILSHRHRFLDGFLLSVVPT